MTTQRRTRGRLALSVLVVFTLLLVFVIKLVDIQVVRASELTAEAEGRRSVPETIYGTRGDIVDANGVVLADSVERYDITVDPSNAVKDTELNEHLAALAPLLGTDAATMFTTITEDRESNFAYLAQGVDVETLRAVRELGITWQFDQRRPSRTYPLGAIAGNLVGYLGTDGPLTGTESKWDECLAASNGSASYERSEDGVRLPGSTVVETEARDGGTVHLTIDSDLQWYAQQALAEQGTAIGADWATAMVVRVKDGHIMAAADWPTADPNDIDASQKEDRGARSFTNPYEPGSTFKSMTVAMLLDQGLVRADTQLIAPGRFPLPDGGYIKDAWAHDDIRFTVAGVLANSSNTGIATITNLMSKEQRHDYLARFGVGERTAANFLNEDPGGLADASSVDSTTNYTQMFGQGITATSAQVASIYQTLGNGGVRVPLTLVESCEAPDGTVTAPPRGEDHRVVSESAADTTVNILESVVSAGSLRNTLTIPGYRVAAKTGTAEVAEGGRYGSDRIVSIAGLAPAENPEYAVVVTFAKPDTMKTSAAAAPTFKKIMTQVLKTFRVTPSTEPAPAIPLTW